MRAMHSGFYVFRRLEGGEELQVAWRPDLASAEKLVSDLMHLWPAEYGIAVATSRRDRCIPSAGKWVH